MSKQPKLVLRESCTRDVTADWTPGRLLEVGAGTGHMIRLFLERSFHGACHDLGAENRALMRARLAEFENRVKVVDQLEDLPESSFDYLLAFEVLEHIEEDAAALREWTRFLRPGGRLLVSVPAHQRKFGQSDRITGHVRRYEREQLTALLRNAGYGSIRLVNYGFPITELTRRVSNWLIGGDRSYDSLSPELRSVRSAQARPAVIDRILSLVSGNVVWPFCVVQRWFYRFDWGDGLVAEGVKLMPPQSGGARALQ